ncbi:MAG: DAK2 domain-containing protein [Solobacterium sp.]|nr:DAK2 domain-containing protein [Solobacterium sp.]
MDKMNGAAFRQMLESGCNNLNSRKEEINALNVFPVPDGDTGTNMSLTFNNGISEVTKSGSEQLPLVAKTLSRGMLMGARGNSGVILSQIFRGFSAAVGDQEELDAAAFSACMLSGSKQAYKAVMRPVEGTILTVVRESAEFASVWLEDHPEAKLDEYMDILCKEAKASLDRTPDLLPVLKEARVVDSGGSGLLTVFDGFRAFLQGAPVTVGENVRSQEVRKAESGYTEEFILRLSSQGKHLYREDRFRNSLGRLGTDIRLVQEDDIVKCRVSTMTPGEVLTFAQRYGEFTRIQIDNNNEERHPSIIDEPVPAEEKEFGIIAVAAGDGLKKLFRDYRADVVVSGGQTMNPSTEDFVAAAGMINARNIFILPNNGNIIMAAKQAAGVIQDKNIIVLETRSIPQGLSACISFDPEYSVEENTDAMKEAIRAVKSGSVTYAIKDTTVEGRRIKRGDYMGILDGDIVLTHRDMVKAACRLIREMCDEDSAVVTLIQGKDATDEDCERVREFVEKNYEVDIDVQKGAQPVYSFLIGVE